MRSVHRKYCANSQMVLGDVQAGVIIATEETMLLQQSPVETCTHNWMIQPAAGPTSLGMCRFCREVREFKNWVDRDYPWVHVR